MIDIDEHGRVDFGGIEFDVDDEPIEPLDDDDDDELELTGDEDDDDFFDEDFDDE